VHIRPEATEGSARRDPSERRFAALDGLRAFAIAAVVWHHTGGPDDFFGRGFGVNTFFAISGFLITTLLLREQAATGTISVPRFYVRRALRILPLYYAVLLLYVALVAALERHTAAGAEFFSHLPWLSTFTANWVLGGAAGRRVIFVFAWSLSMQEQFYLLWPWVLRFARRRTSVVLAMVALLVVVHVPWIPLSQADAIWLGCGLACLRTDPIGARVFDRLAGGWWSAPLALALSLAPVAWPSAPQALTVGALAYLVAACAVRPGFLTPLLVNPVARHVGAISFGVYLLHMLAVNVARRAVPHAPQAVLFAVAFPLAVLAATATHRWFERPIRTLGSRALAPAPVPVALPSVPSTGAQVG